MSPYAAIQNQLLISRIDFLLVEIPISHIRNTIITSKTFIFDIKNSIVEMSILDIHNWIATSNNVHFWYQ